MNNTFKVKMSKRLLGDKYKLIFDITKWNQITFWIKLY